MSVLSRAAAGQGHETGRGQEQRHGDLAGDQLLAVVQRVGRRDRVVVAGDPDVLAAVVRPGSRTGRPRGRARRTPGWRSAGSGVPILPSGSGPPGWDASPGSSTIRRSKSPGVDLDGARVVDGRRDQVGRRAGAWVVGRLEEQVEVGRAVRIQRRVVGRDHLEVVVAGEVDLRLHRHLVPPGVGGDDRGHDGIAGGHRQRRAHLARRDARRVGLARQQDDQVGVVLGLGEHVEGVAAVGVGVGVLAHEQAHVGARARDLDGAAPGALVGAAAQAVAQVDASRGSGCRCRGSRTGSRCRRSRSTWLPKTSRATTVTLGSREPAR